MKCAACGYEYQEGAGQQWSKNDGHGGCHIVGPESFLPISPNVECGKGTKAKWITLYVCPKCGTVIAE